MLLCCLIDSMMALALLPTETRSSNASFHLCRLFLSHLGYMAWEKRSASAALLTAPELPLIIISNNNIIIIIIALIVYLLSAVATDNIVFVKSFFLLSR